METRTKGWMEGGKKIRRSGGGQKEGQRNRRERSSKERGRGGRKVGTMKVVKELIKSILVFQEIPLYKVHRRNLQLEEDGDPHDPVVVNRVLLKVFYKKNLVNSVDDKSKGNYRVIPMFTN